ncbi:hypothetical protein AB0M36_13955 [Actinoplanes sp. NPDC051346]|uniref:hypothetical protein n=1 Tax=Actinoplanes sp. NPDC051346 TaxID=3155048 RepID=UPI003426CEB8
MPVLIVVLGAAPFVVSSLGRRGDGAASGGVVLLGWLGAAAGLVLGIAGLYYHSYLQDRDYASAIHVVDDPVPGFVARPPYLIGRAQAAPNLGDVTGEIVDVTYLTDTDRCGTLVERRGWLAGYEVGLVQEVPLGSNGRRNTCLATDEQVRTWWAVLGDTPRRDGGDQAR